MNGKELLLTAAIVATLITCNAAFAGPANDVLAKLDRMASANDSPRRPALEATVEAIEKNPSEVSKAVLSKLKAKGLTERQTGVYVWALGVAKDQAAFDAISLVYRQNTSLLIRGNCLVAISALGGKRAGEFLMEALNHATAKDERYGILNLLSQLQYDAVLPKTEEILKRNPQEFYWQSIFIFGKMGDKAVPFLLQKVNDSDRNVRSNSISVLGQWLIAPEATKPLQERYWVEPDAEIRQLILSSLERTTVDLDAMQAFSAQVAAKEKVKKLRQFARETIANISEMRTCIAAFGKAKQPSAAAFQREYDRLFKSFGKKGDYAVLGTSSAPEDAAKLSALRERILQRDSDESFHDYQNVNRILRYNRMLPKKRG